GPGTTVKTVAEELGIRDKTLLGVDAVHNGSIVGRDLDERGMLEILERYRRACIVVSPIGGQGFIFGRGNQQISPEVIRRVGPRNIVVVATKHKLARTPVLRVDTGDPALDQELRGYLRVIADYREEHVMRVM
ncbi:MAG: ATP-NAD kinase, partial [Candidatus Korarchaeota archaeon]|nr:ATP-NAD kinase [Candidatus Korarchaeota archaeon]